MQAGTGTGKSLAYLVPAVAPRHRDRASRPSSPPRRWPCRPRSSTATCRGSPSARAAPRAPPDLRAGQGPAQLPVPHKLEGGFPDDEDGCSSVGQVDAAASPARRRGGAAARVGRRRPSPATATSSSPACQRARLAPGVGLGARVPGRQVPAGRRVLRRAGPRGGQGRRRHRHQPLASWPSTPSRAARCCPSTTCSSSTRRHELVDRVTSTITDELTAAHGREPRPSGPAGMAETRADHRRGGDLLAAAARAGPGGAADSASPTRSALALARVRDTARAVQSELKPPARARRPTAPARWRGPRSTRSSRTPSASSRSASSTSCGSTATRAAGPVLRVAPMSVAMLVRDKVFERAHRRPDLGDARARRHVRRRRRHASGCAARVRPQWQGLDVGSPFDYPRAGHRLRRARTCRRPAATAWRPRRSTRSRQLVRAAGGRTLGLFSSMRAAQAATEAMRERFGDRRSPFLCQGEDQITTLVRQFARDPRTCLFGTLSLWQGVDVPGSSCQLVIIDRIPFPRPDDPLASARSQAIARMGGNGFMAVSATHAALRLAQGAGRLVRAVRRPRRRRLPRLPDDDRPLCRLPPALAAAVLADDRPGDGAGGAQAARRDGRAAAAGGRAGAARADRRRRGAGGRRRPRRGCRGVDPSSARSPGPAAAGVVAHRRHARATRGPSRRTRSCATGIELGLEPRRARRPPRAAGRRRARRGWPGWPRGSRRRPLPTRPRGSSAGSILARGCRRGSVAELASPGWP